MEKGPSNIIGFDILLKAPGSDKTPHVDNIAQFKPPPENIAKCHRWLASRGVTCHATDFGLACSAPVGLFETLFSTKVECGTPAPGAPHWHCSSPPEAPREIEEYVDQISISVLPELY
ncbi:MAG: protease pro-enzyme activation domain-containing protein [Planctomycetota bacterium]|jgi:hypothetical protein